MLAAKVGHFVCVTAGHHMEATLAARGVGAVELSSRDGSRLLTVDIGGGTTKFALLDQGSIVRTAALHLGGRLAVFDSDLTLVRLEPAGARLAARCGFGWTVGARATEREIAEVARHMAGTIDRVLRQEQSPPDDLWLTDPLGVLGEVDGVVLSGGVGAYFYEPATPFHGDLGSAMASALRAGSSRWCAPVLPAPASPIRATVVGAAQHSVQVSGSTMYVSEPSPLPLRNLSVVHVPVTPDGVLRPDAVRRTIEESLTTAGVREGHDAFALALRWGGVPSFGRLRALADGICGALPVTLSRRAPLCLVVDGDVAQLLGHLLGEESGLGSPMVAIDGISLRHFEFIDVSALHEDSRTVQVTIKSLVFDL
jgi:ethanolamine utilization protein EutA